MLSSAEEMEEIVGQQEMEEIVGEEEMEDSAPEEECPAVLCRRRSPYTITKHYRQLLKRGPPSDGRLELPLPAILASTSLKQARLV